MIKDCGGLAIRTMTWPTDRDKPAKKEAAVCRMPALRDEKGYKPL